MNWKVDLEPKVEKQIRNLSETIRKRVITLIMEIEYAGPVRGNWPNYGKLDDNRHHCHIKKGKPCYVAVWEVIDKKIKLVEVKYVGTHEKAPY